MTTAAQALRSGMGEEAFIDALQARLAHPEPNVTIERRPRWLRGIPFRAVLTTNFDGLLSGLTPGREAYLSVLRAEGHRLVGPAHVSALSQAEARFVGERGGSAWVHLAAYWWGSREEHE